MSRAERHTQTTQVLIANKVAVDKKCHCKIECHAAPNHYVIENSPIGCIQSNLFEYTRKVLWNSNVLYQELTCAVTTNTSMVETTVPNI